MPVVTVAIGPHAESAQLLSDVAEAVASALHLGAGDVIAVHLPTGGSAISGIGAKAASPWPLVTICGSPREREKMDAARSAAESAARAWCATNDVGCEGVWTQWQTPVPQ